MFNSGKKHEDQLTLLENGAAGSCASIFSGFYTCRAWGNDNNLIYFSALVLCPTELIKCRLQAARQMGMSNTSIIKMIRY